MGDYSLDQTLAKLSNRLDELQKHQRLSRFDAVMFLAYPLITLVLPALASVGMQTDNPVLEKIRFYGIWTPKDIFNLAYSPFVAFVVTGFVYFVLSYLRDSLVGRIRSVFFVVLGLCWIAFGLLMSPVPWPFYGSETPEPPVRLVFTVMVVRLGYGLIFFGFGALLGSILLGCAVCDRFYIWVGRNTPKMIGAAGLEPGPSLDSGMRRLAKWSWILLLLPSYAVAVVLSIAIWRWSVGYVSGTILYHYWVLTGLVVVTVVLLLRHS